MRVLSLIPGFDVEKIPGQWLDRIIFYSWMPEEQCKIAESDVPLKGKERFGYQMRGVERTGLHDYLVQTAKNLGAEFKWKHKFVSLQQTSDEVTVKFENGHTDTASFVVGCDGLHSNTRVSLFGREKADFTGLTQVSGPSSYLEDYSDLWILDRRVDNCWRYNAQTFPIHQSVRKQQTPGSIPHLAN